VTWNVSCIKCNFVLNNSCHNILKEKVKRELFPLPFLTILKQFSVILVPCQRVETRP